MNTLKIMIVSLVILLLSGCAGTGFQKKTTLMPDEVNINAKAKGDSNNKDWSVKEVYGGLKWKLE